MIFSIVKFCKRKIFVCKCSILKTRSGKMSKTYLCLEWDFFKRKFCFSIISVQKKVNIIIRLLWNEKNINYCVQYYILVYLWISDIYIPFLISYLIFMFRIFWIFRLHNIKIIIYNVKKKKLIFYRTVLTLIPHRRLD